MIRLLSLLILCLVITFNVVCFAQTSTFTYQGLLKSSGSPVSSATQLRFQLWDDLNSGTQIGSDITQDITPDNGLFTTELDFGSDAFDGSPRFLDIAVVSSAGTVTTLTPRIRLQSVPYAFRSLKAKQLDLPFSATSNQGASAVAVIELTNNDPAGTVLHAAAGTGFGFNYSGAGLWGDSLNSDGIHGTSGTGAGVVGYSLSNIGVYAKTDNGTALYADSASSLNAVNVRNTSGPGLNATANGNYAVQGSCANGVGIQGFSTTGVGVVASSSNGNAFMASTVAGTGAVITSNSGVGLNVSSSSGYGATIYGGGFVGIKGITAGTNGNGVEGVADTGIFAYGVYGHALNGNGGNFHGGNYGILASCSNSSGYGGYFTGKVGISGNLAVAGTLSKGGGTFKIDHPLDPANKYLYHSFVESPDMMNIYNGNIITNEIGEAWVQMPSYFEALNQEFRYQLTCMGQFAQAIVGQEIVSNRFLIRTDKPNIKVSWQVTGVRHDAFANAHRVIAEVEKAGDEKGKYLYPVENGQPETLGINYERDHQLKQSPK